jgi:putative phage-type endonuclease
MLYNFDKLYKYILPYINMTDINQVNNAVDKEMIYFINNNIKDINKIDYIYKKYKDIMNIDKKAIKNRICEINKYRKVLKELVKQPIIKQRTKEWFDARENRLTASDLHDAIQDKKISDMIAKKKAKITKDNTNYNSIKALRWGTMFEPMASRVYSEVNGDVNIYEFGLICDKQNEHFGASPDGINELGIMIEIKCPYSRKIVDGYIPDKYMMQIQGQLAVCNLNECDYIECIFIALEESEYIEEFANNKDANIKHGIIAEYISSRGNSEYTYLYSGSSGDIKKSDEIILDIRNKIDTFNENPENCNYKLEKLTYWKLDKINTQRVVFNKSEWEGISDKIHTFWEKVERFKLLPVERIRFISDDD